MNLPPSFCPGKEADSGMHPSSNSIGRSLVISRSFRRIYMFLTFGSPSGLSPHFDLKIGRSQVACRARILNSNPQTIRKARSAPFSGSTKREGSWNRKDGLHDPGTLLAFCRKAGDFASRQSRGSLSERVMPQGAKPRIPWLRKNVLFN